MSIESAIQDFLVDTQGSDQIITSWVLIAATTNGDDGDIALGWSDGQPKYISLGLIESAKIVLKSEAYFGGGE